MQERETGRRHQSCFSCAGLFFHTWAGEVSRGGHKGGKHAEHHTGAHLWYGVFVLCARICPGNAHGTTAAARTRDHEGTNAADAGQNPATRRSDRETQYTAAPCTYTNPPTARCGRPRTAQARGEGGSLA